MLSDAGRNSGENQEDERRGAWPRSRPDSGNQERAEGRREREEGEER